MTSWLRVRPTSEGWRLFLLVALVGFAAFNTRNNLLFLMFSVGIATVIVSAAAAWLSLKGIEVSTVRGADLYVGEPTVECLRVKNRSRLLDAYAVSVSDLDFPGPPPSTVLARVGKGEEKDAVLPKTYTRRGVFSSRRVLLATAFPFGLLQVSRKIPLSRRLVVFPAVKRVDISFVFRAGMGPMPRRQRAGHTEELFRIREYASGDSMRQVDWKATAKLGALMVREFASEQARRFCIVLDNTWRADAVASDPQFETMVSAAASLASHLASHRFSFRFVTAEDDFPHGDSFEHLRGVLTYLAGVRRQSASGTDLAAWTREAVRSEEVILVLPGHPKSPLFSLASPGLHVINPGVLVLEETIHGT